VCQKTVIRLLYQGFTPPSVESADWLRIYHLRTGLPDGIFSNQKYLFGLILESLAMEDIGIFYGHLFFFWSLGILCSHLVYVMVIWYIFSFLVCCAKKNLATLPTCTKANNARLLI
jgi:hypothetical protein